MRRVNAVLDAAAERITGAVGTMWCAIVFACLALVSLPNVLASGDPVQIVGWLAQTFLQLVLLSVIMVGSRRDSVRLMELIEDTHRLELAEVRDVRAVLLEARVLLRLARIAARQRGH